MCGIAGKIGSQINVSEAAEQSVLKALQHRGPDAQATLHLANAWLAHTRLSILDPDARSNQPFKDDTGRYALVYNGEIYNFMELKSELESQGETFETESDTEVLLKLLIRHKAKCLNKLNGFFAFAFYDNETGEALLARDRYGIKPLYYSESEGALCFASEIRALNCLKPSSEINRRAVEDLLTFTFVGPDHSISADYTPLEPGTFLKWNTTSRIERWYDNGSLRHGELTDILQQAVEDRLVSDVPLGCFLSGGIDSSIIAALAIRQMTGLKTFSLGFKGQDFLDETSHAENVADYIGSEHYSLYVDEQEALNALPEFLSALDEPFADSSAFAVYLITREASKHVTVALSGDGADELFGGYNRHRAFLRLLDQGIEEKGASALAKWLPENLSREGRVSNKLRQLKKFSRLSGLSPEQVYRELSRFVTTEELVELGITESRRSFSRFGEKRLLEDYLVQDQRFVLPGDMLIKADRMGMANSLEIRTPFLDHRVVEFARGLNRERLLDKRLGKKALRNAFSDILPSEVFSREKHGFEIPLKKWIAGPWHEVVRNQLRKEIVDEVGVISQQKAEYLMQQIHREKFNPSLVWGLFVLHYWVEKNLLSS